MNQNTDWLDLVNLVRGQAFTQPTPKPKPKAKSKVDIDVDPGKKFVDTWDAMAITFAVTYQEKLRYSPENKKWLVWNGYIWEWDNKGYVRELVKMLGRDMEKYATLESQKKWGAKLLEPAGIDKVLSMAMTDPRVAINLEEMDSEVYEINTPGGTVDLFTGELTAPDPKKLNKRSVTVLPDPNMPTPQYDNFMAQTFAGDPELSEYVETMIGVSLIKSQHEQIFMYLHGAAGSGKGTLMNLVQEVIGKGEHGYSQYVDSDMFVQKKNQPHPTELMQFLGARLVVTSEISQGQSMDTGKLKKTTGGDNITGRYMGKDFVTFAPTHTLWLMANDKLQVPHDDKGVWRRLRTVPFLHAKDSGAYTKHLFEIIHQEEGPGVLAKWIARAGEALNQGFYTPESVLKANEEYIKDQDTFTDWMEYCCDTSDPSGFTPGEALRSSYRDWCLREKLALVTPKKFAIDMSAKGYSPTSQNNIRGFKGIKLNNLHTYGYQH